MNVIRDVMRAYTAQYRRGSAGRFRFKGRLGDGVPVSAIIGRRVLGKRRSRGSGRSALANTPGLMNRWPLSVVIREIGPVLDRFRNTWREQVSRRTATLDGQQPIR